MAKNGLNLIMPTSLSTTGTLGIINLNGSVTFSDCTLIRPAGVFTAQYTNYMIIVKATHTGTSTPISMRLYSGATAESGASNYIYSELSGSDTTIASSRTTGSSWKIMNSYATQRCATVINLYAPFLAQTTAYRSLSIDDFSSASYADWMGSHNQSTSYDNFAIITSTLGITGTLAVYGLVK
jgi:hypothetical protein